MRKLIRLGLLVSSLSLFFPASAHADEPIDAARVQEFTAARDLYNAKNYAAALPKWRALVDQTKSPNARLFLARTYRELGRLPEAFDEFEITLRDASAKAETEPKYAQTRDAASAELALMRPRVGQLVIAIADAPEGSKVTLNGKAIPQELLGSTISIAPGTQVIVVVPPSGKEVRREIVIKGGENKTIALAVRGDAPAVVTDTKSTTPSSGLVRKVGYVVGGVGVVSLGVFVVTGLMADSKFSSLKEECGTTRCVGTKYEGVVDNGKTFETISNVTLIAGAAMVLTAVPFVIFGGPSGGPQSTASVTPEPGGARFSLSGRF